MRDADLMLEILKELKDSPSGQSPFLKTMDMDLERYHHAELLCDSGLATWRSDSFLRITNQGYDFINAINQDKKHVESFKNLLSQGKSLLDVVHKIISIVNSV